MWELLKDCSCWYLLETGIGVALMCILSVGKGADYEMKKLKAVRTNNMNFKHLYQWFLSNAQSLVLMSIVVIGIYLGSRASFQNLSVSCSCLDCCRLGIQCWRCGNC